VRNNVLYASIKFSVSFQRRAALAKRAAKKIKLKGHLKNGHRWWRFGAELPKRGRGRLTKGSGKM